MPMPPGRRSRAEQKQELEKIIKNYLVANPEVFLEAQTALESKMEKEQAEKLKVAIAENARDIYRDPTADIAGNPNGDITVVEFFDYNCGYCKRGLHDVIKLGRKRSQGARRLQGVADPVEGLGGSLTRRHRRRQAGQVLGHAQGHARGQGTDERSAMRWQVATKLGLDIEKLKKDMASPEVEAEIKKSEALAKKMGVNGTPHFLVGDRAIPGAPEDLYDQLENHVTELRKSGCSYC